jgi:predicted transport protein
MWTCPKCNRNFRNANQNHSCILVLKENLFAKRPVYLNILYNKIVGFVKTLGDYREETVLPDVIFFKTQSSFLAVKVKKDHLEIEFFLSYHEEDPSIAKWLQTSKHRFAHVVKIDREEDITMQLTGWIKQSYHLVIS